jgi:hypothetical protein
MPLPDQLDDPDLAQAEQQADTVVVPEDQHEHRPDYDPSIKALIKQFEEQNEWPVDVEAVIKQMDAQRKYVHTDANLPDVPGGVCTNYLFKHQLTHKAQINARQPSVTVKQKRKIGSMVPEIKKLLDGYAETQSILIEHFMGPDEADLKSVLDGAIQDADTVGITFIKMDWLEDLKRDPTGAYRPSDFQDTVARLTLLTEQFQAGLFSEQDAQYADLVEAKDSVQRQMNAELWRKMMPAGPEHDDPRKLRWDGLPTKPQITELPKYRGYQFSTLMPEDCRWDFAIFQPENFKRGDHFSYCTYMTERKIREFFGIPAEKSLESADGGSAASSARDQAMPKSQNPADRSDTNSGQHDGKLKVWTRMDRVRNRIYNWIEGGCEWLRTPEAPEIVTSNWFNVWPLYFNRTTGRFLPISYTTLGRPLQDEINRVRTHKRQAKDAAYDRYAVAAGLFDEEDLEAMEECPPNGMFATKRKIDELAKGFFRLPGQYKPEIHDVTEERQELAVLLGQSAASQGVTRDGADSATEAAIANQTADVVLNDHKDVLNSLRRSIAQAMAETNNQALPEENAKAIAGTEAVFPMFDRQQLWAHMDIEVEAFSSGQAAQEKELSKMDTVMGIGERAGIGQNPGGPIFNPIAVMKKATRIVDWREDPTELVILPPPPPMMPPMPPGGGQGGGPGAPAAPDGEPTMPGGPNGANPPGSPPADAGPAVKPPPLPMANAAPKPPPAAGPG